MRALFVLLLAGTALTVQAQPERTWQDSCAAYWARMEAEFRDPAHSPLAPKERATFKGLERFPYDPAYHVTATFTPAESGRTFRMRTTTDRAPEYRPYGTLQFDLNGTPCQLTVYQNVELVKKPGMEHYLFLPFTDLTNGQETYGGGRYLDLEGPLGPHVELDLNKAYNPYCAYDHRFSCPIPPAENHLQVMVRAGVLAFHE